MKKDDSLNELIIYIQNIGIDQRGGITRFLKNNFNNIEYLTSLITFKEIIEYLNKTLDLSLDYKYFNLVFNKIKKENNHNERKPDFKKELDLKQINQQPTKKEEVKPIESKPTFKTQPIQTPSKKINDDGLTEEEAKNPIFHIKNVKIPKTFKRELLDEGVTLEEVKALKMEYYSISEAVNKLNAFLTKRKEIERRKELDELFKRGN